MGFHSTLLCNSSVKPDLMRQFQRKQQTDARTSESHHHVCFCIFAENPLSCRDTDDFGQTSFGGRTLLHDVYNAAKETLQETTCGWIQALNQLSAQSPTGSTLLYIK